MVNLKVVGVPKNSLRIVLEVQVGVDVAPKHAERVVDNNLHDIVSGKSGQTANRVGGCRVVVGPRDEGDTIQADINIVAVSERQRIAVVVGTAQRCLAARSSEVIPGAYRL